LKRPLRIRKVRLRMISRMLGSSTPDGMQYKTHQAVRRGEKAMVAKLPQASRVLPALLHRGRSRPVYTYRGDLCGIDMASR